MGSNSKPLGGITTLYLGVAPLDGAAPTLPDSGVEIPLLEDQSLYTETVEYIGALKVVKHSLTLFTAAEYELPDELIEGLERGFVALLECHSGEQINCGWSQEALGDRPLRLVSCSMSSESKRASRGYKEWLMESTDSTTNI